MTLLLKINLILNKVGLNPKTVWDSLQFFTCVLTLGSYIFEKKINMFFGRYIRIYFVVTKLFRGDAYMSISVQHIRHVTSIIPINGKRLLIDPMLSEAG